MAPSQRVAQDLESVASAAVDAKSQQYEAILRSISTAPTADDLNAVIDHVFHSGLGVVALGGWFEQLLSTLQGLDDDEIVINVGKHTLETLADQPALFVEPASNLRELMATAYENSENWAAAAKILSEIQLDTSQRQVPVEYRIGIWIRIVRNNLEEDTDPVAAELYLNKLKAYMHTVSDPALELHFNLSQARISDGKREFLLAAQKYHDISYSTSIEEEERYHTLGMAIKCAVLAPAGPARSRTLGRLYKDERAVQLPEYPILEKMYLHRLLSPAEVDKFAEGLEKHQLAITSDGSTVLARAMVEHNLHGASRLYGNIGFEALGALLGLDSDKAEETTARMIEQGRLVGHIDQLDGIVYFGGGEASGQGGSGNNEVKFGKEMRQWDANVESLAEEVENVTNALQREFPDFVAAHLATS